jgi:hypothetical protein
MSGSPQAMARSKAGRAVATAIPGPETFSTRRSAVMRAISEGSAELDIGLVHGEALEFDEDRGAGCDGGHR